MPASPNTAPGIPRKPANLSIPPRPEVVNLLLAEKDKEQPDLRRVAQAIMADVGLAGAMLKAVNSPAFGLRRKATNVATAVDLLGMKQVATLAMGLVLRHVEGGGPAMDRFWDTAEKVALTTSYLAGRLRGIGREEAYTYGLFHDCGIPMMMQRYPDYKTVLLQANQAYDEAFTEVEDKALGTHHAAMGYFLAKSWYLPDDLCQAILRHHETGVYDPGAGAGEGVLTMIGIGHIAGHVHHTYMRTGDDAEWAKFKPLVCRHFGLDQEDLINLLEDAQGFLTEL